VEFLDTCLEEDSYIQSEVLRCIHIGLLCVQQYPNDRPTMTSVLVMLTSDSTLPQPKEPIFLTDEITSEQKISYSTNEVSITMLEPR